MRPTPRFRLGREARAVLVHINVTLLHRVLRPAASDGDNLPA